MIEVRKCLRCGSSVEVKSFNLWLTAVGLCADYSFVCCGCGLRHHITQKFSQESAVKEWNDKTVK